MTFAEMHSAYSDTRKRTYEEVAVEMQNYGTLYDRARVALARTLDRIGWSMRSERFRAVFLRASSYLFSR